MSRTRSLAAATFATLALAFASTAEGQRAPRPGSEAQQSPTVPANTATTAVVKSEGKYYLAQFVNPIDPANSLATNTIARATELNEQQAQMLSRTPTPARAAGIIEGKTPEEKAAIAKQIQDALSGKGPTGNPNGTPRRRAAGVMAEAAVEYIIPG